MSTNTVSHRVRPAVITGLTATGTNQATAFLLTNSADHEFTTVAASTGAILPAGTLPSEISVFNGGASTLAVYPPVGGSINAGTANASVSLAAGSGLTYWASTSSNWYSKQTSSSGGSGTPGGTNGQIQFDSAGSFGGFTASGDATINTATGAVAVTKTGGVSFAASATTDATVATNITTGNLPVAQLPSIATLTILSNTTGGTAAAGANTISSVLGAGFPNIGFPSAGPVKVAGGMIFKCGLCTAVSNVAVATSILGSPANAVGTLTIPANALAVGSILRWYMTGIWGATASSPTFGFTVLLNGVAILTYQGLSTLPNAQTTSPFFNSVGYINVQAIGASAKAGGLFSPLLVNNGFGNIGQTCIPGGSSAASNVSFASNSNALFDIQIVFSAANTSNMMTIQSFQLFLDN